MQRSFILLNKTLFFYCPDGTTKTFATFLAMFSAAILASMCCCAISIAIFSTSVTTLFILYTIKKEKTSAGSSLV